MLHAKQPCFLVHSTITWYVDVDNLPPNIGRSLYGVTINSRNTDIGSRFIRFRFPHVFFEASQLMSVTPVATSGINTRAIWKAWARGGTTSGLVAYGIVSEEMIWHTQERKQVLKIVKRHFTVLQVQQPELFTPVPYPRQIPPLSRKATSWPSPLHGL
ncbi:hypothetical protein BDQ17DRAFT_111419 [Cyathus striatus]|nr:hypothetical protein BDQ17DRAFT_111419 [Cyathus striatus]